MKYFAIKTDQGVKFIGAENHYAAEAVAVENGAKWARTVHIGEFSTYMGVKLEYEQRMRNLRNG